MSEPDFSAFAKIMADEMNASINKLVLESMGVSDSPASAQRSRERNFRETQLGKQHNGPTLDVQPVSVVVIDEGKLLP